MLRLQVQLHTRPEGAEPIGGTPEDLAKLIAAETTKWKEVVRLSGAKLD